MAMNAARRRYLARFTPMMVAYVASVMGVTWVFNNQPPEGVLKYALAILPALPILGVIAIMGRYLVEETDEFVRMRHAMVLLVSIGLTLSFCAAWGFLEIYAGVPAIGLFNVVWGFFGAQLISSPIVNWWYR